MSRKEWAQVLDIGGPAIKKIVKVVETVFHSKIVDEYPFDSICHHVK